MATCMRGKQSGPAHFWLLKNTNNELFERSHLPENDRGYRYRRFVSILFQPRTYLHYPTVISRNTNSWPLSAYFIHFSRSAFTSSFSHPTQENKNCVNGSLQVFNKISILHGMQKVIRRITEQHFSVTMITKLSHASVNFFFK